MDSARLAIAALATVGCGILLGLAANPTMRTFPEADWRARYRLVAPQPDPAPQPGVSYYGDGSTAWLFGGGPPHLSEGWGRAEPLPPLRIPIYRYDPPPPEPEPLLDMASGGGNADDWAERAAAQAVVAEALHRSAPEVTDEPATQADDDAGDAQPNAPPDRSDANSATQSWPTDPT